jgi:hypothetical protein
LIATVDLGCEFVNGRMQASDLVVLRLARGLRTP